MTETKPNEKKDFFNIVFEALAWMQIVVSPFLISIVIAVLIYIAKPNMTGLIISICIVCLGLVAGIVWATRIKRKKGSAINFMSKVNESGELNHDKHD